MKKVVMTLQTASLQKTLKMYLHYSLKFCTLLSFTYLNIFFVLQQWSFHDVLKTEPFIFHIEHMPCGISHTLPMTCLHRLVGHQLQQRTSLVEVINSFLEGIECRPLLQCTWKLATSWGRYSNFGLKPLVHDKYLNSTGAGDFDLT